MSSLSNYPPGVTGNEYQISGALNEWEETRECPNCEWVGEMHHEWHPQTGTWAWCAEPTGTCISVKQGFEVEPEEDQWEPEPDYGDWRGEDV